MNRDGPFGPPKLTFCCLWPSCPVFHSSSVSGFQYRRTGRSGGPHRNNRGDSHQRLHHGLWDPASGRSLCHGNPVLSAAHRLHRPRQPGGAVRSPNMLFINLQCLIWPSLKLWVLIFQIPLLRSEHSARLNCLRYQRSANFPLGILNI